MFQFWTQSAWTQEWAVPFLAHLVFTGRLPVLNELGSNSSPRTLSCGIWNALSHSNRVARFPWQPLKMFSVSTMAARPPPHLASLGSRVGLSPSGAVPGRPHAVPAAPSSPVLGSLASSSHLHTWSWSPHLEGGLTAALPPGCPPPIACHLPHMESPCGLRVSPEPFHLLKPDAPPTWRWTGSRGQGFCRFYWLLVLSTWTSVRPRAGAQKVLAAWALLWPPPAHPRLSSHWGGGGLRGRLPSQHCRHQPRPTACKDGTRSLSQPRGFIFTIGVSS